MAGMSEKDAPLEVMDSAGSFHAVVVDLAGVRLQRGRTPPRNKVCEHKSMIFSGSERRIWCEDCERTIDSFDAFATLTTKFEAMVRDAKAMQTQAADALASTVVRRAAKTMDKSWGGKMAPCCPHCRGALLPEDFANGAASSFNADMERARRKRRSVPPPPPPIPSQTDPLGEK